MEHSYLLALAHIVVHSCLHQCVVTGMQQQLFFFAQQQPVRVRFLGTVLPLMRPVNRNRKLFGIRMTLKSAVLSRLGTPDRNTSETIIGRLMVTGRNSTSTRRGKRPCYPVSPYEPFKTWQQRHNYLCVHRKTLVKPKFLKSWNRKVNQYTNRFAKTHFHGTGIWNANMETVHSRRYREWRDTHVLNNWWNR